MIAKLLATLMIPNQYELNHFEDLNHPGGQIESSFDTRLDYSAPQLSHLWIVPEYLDNFTLGSGFQRIN